MAGELDERRLKVLLRDLKGDHACHRERCTGKHITEECLATQLLMNLEFQSEFRAWPVWRRKTYHENLREVKISQLGAWRHVLLVNPQDLHRGGMLGEGTFGRVYKAKWLGEKYAKKSPKAIRRISNKRLQFLQVCTILTSCLLWAVLKTMGHAHTSWNKWISHSLTYWRATNCQLSDM